jgi:hypothetical protein
VRRYRLQNSEPVLGEGIAAFKAVCDSRPRRPHRRPKKGLCVALQAKKKVASNAAPWAAALTARNLSLGSCACCWLRKCLIIWSGFRRLSTARGARFRSQAMFEFAASLVASARRPPSGEKS